MNFDFYSDRADALKILEFIFDDLDMVLFDLYSDYGQEINSYKSIADVSERLSKDASHSYSHFQVWAPRHRGSARFERIDLDPHRCEGHTFRYRTHGFGLIQLYFSYPQKTGLNPSHIGHFDERGAFARQHSYPLDEVTGWDWVEIQRSSRKLRYHIRKRLAVAKVSDTDLRDILPGALERFQQGLFRLPV